MFNYNRNYMFILRIEMYLFVVTHVIIQFCMFYVKVHVQIGYERFENLGSEK